MLDENGGSCDGERSKGVGDNQLVDSGSSSDRAHSAED